MSPHHLYGESLCQRKSVFSLWFLRFFAANCFFQDDNNLHTMGFWGIPRNSIQKTHIHTDLTSWPGNLTPRLNPPNLVAASRQSAADFGFQNGGALTRRCYRV